MPAWKIAIMLGWGLVAFSLFSAADSELIGWARIGFWATLAVHGLEFAVFQRKLRAAGGSMAEHFLLTLALGMFHIQSVDPAEAGDA